MNYEKFVKIFALISAKLNTDFVVFYMNLPYTMFNGDRLCIERS